MWTRIHIRFPKRQVLFCLCILCIHTLRAQKDSGLHALQEVVIQSDKLEKFNAGKKTQVLDSSTLALYNTSSLADLLSTQTSMHVKSYGGGNIATMSFRGGNANQTAVLWNGINIQNNMLGQNDLSLVQSMLFDNVSLEFGGNSALWGSGAMSGAVHLNNQPLFNRGITTRVSAYSGSFGSRKLSTGIVLSYKKIVSNTKVYYNTVGNNYTYRDTTDKEHPDKQLSHASYRVKGFMQELSFLAGAFQKVNVRAWYNETYRNLPSYTALVSKQSQLDQNLKLNADWTYSKRNYATTARGAYLHDVLNYSDSLAGDSSKSRSSTIVVENEHTFRHGHHLFNAGVNYTHYNASTTGYASIQQVNKLALFASHQWKGLHDKLSTTISLRQEFSSQYKVPLTGSVGAGYVLTKSVSLKVNAARSFRQPTLNDLYWNPGGNPNLKPEDALGFEGGIAFNKTMRHWNLYGEGTYFNRHTTNWIIWLPQGSVWTPQNIAQVYSRGTETNFSLAYRDKGYNLKLYGSTAYVLSTNQKTLSENDNSKDRQLIYTPRYTVQGGLMLSWQNASLLYSQSYTGYRFTSSDNTSWLPPYSIGTFRASYYYTLYQVRLQLSFALNNVFNANYQVVASRPMPPRNYEVGLTLSFNNKSNNN